jgi:hypothetical protein
MIQFYINSRPVPRAIARHHLQQSDPARGSGVINALMTKAVQQQAIAVRYLESHGVAVAQVRA